MLAFNLLPPARQQQRDFQKKLEKALLYGKLVLGLTAMSSLFTLFVFVYLKHQADALVFTLNAQKNDEKNSEIANIQKDAQVFNEELKNFDAQLPKRKWSSLLISLASLTPKGISLIGIARAQEKNQKSEIIDRLTMNGKALTRQHLISFQNALEASPLFSNVVLPLSNFEKQKDISFSITLQIN